MNETKNRKKVVVLIQGRMGSTRLPGKVLRKVNGRTLIEWVHYRLSFAKEVDQIIIGTSIESSNDAIEALAKEKGIPCFRGSEDDLISRYYGTAKAFDADAIVRICADCPFADPTIVDTLVKVYRADDGKTDFICNNTPPTYPHGLDVEVIPTRTLARLDSEVEDTLYREWLTMTIVENRDRFSLMNIEGKEDLRHVRLTVDYAEDLALAEEIFVRLHKEGEVFTLPAIFTLLEREPALMEINAKWVNTKIDDSVRKNTEFQTLKTQAHGKETTI